MVLITYWRKSSQNLVIGDESIMTSDKALYIGVMFDETVSMNDHIAHISKGTMYGK